MSKKKIADSIIIKVGGGIREVPREPAEIAESRESVRREPKLDQTEDVHPFGVELGSNASVGSDISK